MKDSFTPTFFRPISDVGFKKLFASEGNEDLTIQLLNSIIDDEVITEVEYLNPVHTIKAETTATFDLYCKTADDKRIIVEMQKGGSDKKFFPNRAIAYSSLAIMDMWRKNGRYSFDKLYFIGILNYSQFRGRKQWLTKSQLRASDDNYLVNENYLQIYVELPKLAASASDNPTLREQFLMAISNLDKYKSRPEAYSDISLDRLISESSYANLTQDERQNYDKEMSTEEERQSYLKILEQEAVERGMEQGIQQGIQQGKLDDARKFKAAGISIDTICQCTGLEKETVEAM